MNLKRLKLPAKKCSEQIKRWQQTEWWPLVGATSTLLLLFVLVFGGQKLYQRQQLQNPKVEKTIIKRNPLAPHDLQAKTIEGDLVFGLDNKNKAVSVSVQRHNTGIEFSTPLNNAKIEYGPEETTFVDRQTGNAISYSAIDNGLKEKIILQAPPEQNQFISQLKIDHLKAYYQGKEIVFADQNDTYQFHLEAPYAYDSAGNYTYAVSYKLIELDPEAELDLAMEKAVDHRLIVERSEDVLSQDLLNLKNTTFSDNTQPNQRYQLITLIDQDWLNSAERQYPITIDPTVVHDTSAEFNGYLNNVADTGSGSSPNLASYYQELNADEHTVGLWHLNETSGSSVADSAGSGNTGTANGTTISSGLLANGREFTYTNTEYISVPDDSSLDLTDAYTLEAWIYPQNSNEWRSIVNKSGFQTAYGMMMNTNDLLRCYTNNSNNLDSSTAIPDDQWTHVACAWDGTNKYVYINGQLDNTGTWSGTLTNSSDALYIGRDVINSNYTFDGIIDEVRISNVARSPEEIAAAASRAPSAVYTSPVIDLTSNVNSWSSFTWTELGVMTGDGETPYSSTNLVAHWKLNETSGTTADNAEGTAALDGTLSGFDSTASQDADPDSGWTADNRRWGAGALMFDGSNSYVSVADNSSLELTDPFSISFWMKTDEDNNKVILEKDGNNGYSIQTTGLGTVQMNVGGTGITTRKTYTDNQWHHFIFVYDSTNGDNIFVDGQSDVASNVLGNPSYSTGSFYIGGRAANYVLDGTLDSIQLYDRALSETEALSLYNAGNIQFQTRVGSDASPDDGSGWDNWQSVSGETQIESFDSFSAAPTCTGADSVSGNVYTFTSNGTFSCPSDVTAEILVVAGGGGGGKSDSSTRSAGGGGAGGLIYEEEYTISAGNTSVTVGAGGDGSLGDGGSGTEVGTARSGSNSSFGDLTAVGGGGGGNGGAGDGADGGSGGGSGRNETSAYGSGTTGQGNDGAVGSEGFGDVSAGGGGGGAGAAGSAASGTTGGNGGNGITIDITGTNVTYAGGGGGGSIGGTAGSGGSGGGGGGNSGGGNGTAGTANTGGGGGGASDTGNGGDGGSGVVIIKVLPTNGFDFNSNLIEESIQSVIKKEGAGSAQLDFGTDQIDDNTVLLYRFDETNGDLAGDDIFDSSGNNYHGEIVGSNLATAIVDGVVNKARKFGNGDYVVIPPAAMPTGSQVSISFWMKGDSSLPLSTTVFAAEDSSGNRTCLAHLPWNNGNVYFDCGNSGSSYNRINKAANSGDYKDKWNHWVFTKNASAGTLKIYLNGQLWHSGTGLTYNLQSSTGFYVGGSPTNNVWPGVIDEFRVDNIERDAEEVAQMYELGLNQRINKTLTSVDLSAKNALPFWIASDRVGTFLETTISESLYANGLPDDNTVALWHFDEPTNDACDGGGDDVCDVSSNDNDGDISSSPTIVEGKIGQARKFDGGDDYVSFPSSSSLQLTGDATWEGWVKADLPLSARGSMIFKHYNNEYEIIMNTDGQIQVYHGDGSWEEINEPTALVNDNVWTHFAVVRDQAVKKYYWYIDGVYQGDDDYVETPAASSNPVYIGSRSGSSSYFPGILDEIHISNVARTATEIRQSYERGKRSHQVTIHFGASLDSGNLIASTSDTSFTIDATTKGLENKGSKLYPGDTIIIKENVAGTEYIAQGDVATVNESTGAVTVAGWDTGSTAPSGGFTANATVFKWQREYFPIEGGFLDTDKDAITNLTLRLTDGHLGGSIWLDDLRSLGDYLTNPTGSTITSALSKRYFQYRAIFTTVDQLVSPSISAVTLNYVNNNVASDAPVFTSNSAQDNLKTSDTTPTIIFSGSDDDDDDLTFEVAWDTDADFASASTAASDSDAGFSDPSESDPFPTGDNISYTWQSALTNDSTYFYRVRSKDPGGSNSWGDWSETRSFTIDTSLAKDSWFQTQADQFSSNILNGLAANSGNHSLEIGLNSISSADSIDNWISTDNAVLKIMAESSIKTEGSGSIKFGFDPYGDGSDGALTPSGSFNLSSSVSGGRSYADGIVYRVNSNPGSNTIVTSDNPNGLAVGDEILLINLQGTGSDVNDVGNYEFLRIARINSNTITTANNISKSYDGASFSNQKVIIQRIPNYSSVSLDSSDSITVNAWDGLSTSPSGTAGYYSGIVAFKVSGSLTVGSSASINAAGKGYRADSTSTSGGETFSSDGGGGAGGVWPSLDAEDGSYGGGGGGGAYGSSEGDGGSGGAGAGGGGGSASGTNASRGGGGGGGGYATAGSGGAGYQSGGSPGAGGDGNGNDDTYSDGRATAGGGGGGDVFGSATLSKIYFGTAGGTGGTGSGTPGQGGNGGGIIIVGAKSISNSGTISANGGNGSNGAGSNSNFNSGGGGGGAGGSIRIISNTPTLGTSLVTATGGSGGTGTYSYAGGAGGSGRIRLEAFSTSSGSTNPAASSATPEASASQTISSQNLSAIDDLRFSARASTTGQLTQFQIGESTASEQTYNTTINSSDTWENKTWDISGIADTSLDSIAHLGWEVSDTSDSFDFYFDNFGYPASSGTALTKLITAANIRSDSPTYWGRLTNNDNQSGSNLSYQVYDQNQNLVSDFDLPGNSSGFSAADINLSTMTVADYPSIYLKANFNDPAAILYDWSVNLQFAPATPTIDSSSLAYPNLSFTMSSTDADSDYLQYKVTICSDANLSVNCIEYDQSSSQTGWTGQNANSNTAYTSGSTASFSATNTLNYGATYYYKVSVKDPAGTDRWVDSTSGSETTNNQPSPPTDLLTEGQTNPSNVTDLTPEFSAIYRDPDASDQATAYQLQVSTYRNFYSSLWDSGKVSISNLDVDTRSSDISYSGPSLSYDGSTYFWRIRFYDSEDIVGYWSNNAQFTMNRLAGPSKCLLQRNPSTGQITVTWEDNNTLIDTFTIQRNVNNTGFVNLATGVNSSLRQYLDATSTLNNKYQYRIAVVYGGTTGDWCLTPILDPYNSQLNFSGLDLSGLNFE